MNTSILVQGQSPQNTRNMDKFVTDFEWWEYLGFVMQIKKEMTGLQTSSGKGVGGFLKR